MFCQQEEIERSHGMMGGEERGVSIPQTKWAYSRCVILPDTLAVCLYLGESGAKLYELAFLSGESAFEQPSPLSTTIEVDFRERKRPQITPAPPSSAL